MLFVSGAAWLALQQWGQVAGEFGPRPHPAQTWLMKIHGAAAMIALILFGTMIPLHIRRGLRAKINRFTGTTMIALSLLLVASGYALYYVGGEQSRRVSALVHDFLGLGFPLLLVWHIWRGRRLGTTPPSSKP
ncbi:MAG: DUF4405 domain-containing protein [Verrucomicrobiota bacterium]|nr:DUF4405 domain-containing protein [Verrucomicrobiota bacterium]